MPIHLPNAKPGTPVLVSAKAECRNVTALDLWALSVALPAIALAAFVYFGGHAPIAAASILIATAAVVSVALLGARRPSSRSGV
jgi:hypothetical protein